MPPLEADDSPARAAGGAAGSSYTRADVAGLRRIYLRKVACHDYYTFNEQNVIVRAFWGAHRGRGPFTTA